MNHLFIFNVLLWISSPLHVNCTWTWMEKINGIRNRMTEASSSPTEEYSLILAVEESGLVYLANEEFVTNQKNEIYEKFLFACPPEKGSMHAYINSEFSTTKNALFIAKVEKRSRSPGKKVEVIRHKCQNPVYPSIEDIGWDESNAEVHLYSVGFEVFLDTGRYVQDFINHYPTITLKDERFVWFHVYTIAFRHNTGNVVKVLSPHFSYKHEESETPSEIETMEKSFAAELNYTFGKGTLYEQDSKTNEIYGKLNQESMFQKLGISDRDQTPRNFVDLIQDRYLMEVHLAPWQSFRTPVLRRAAETFGNIAPMWNIIYSSIWYSVEKHVEYLTQAVKAIHVITGTYGTLQLSEKEIYLGPNNTIEIPATFFKIVSYSPNPKRKYSILIVTSNNPYDEFDKTYERICKESKCIDFGWEYIQQDFYALGRTSCCKLTKEILVELKMQDYDQLIDQTLNLNEVPHWRVDNLTLDVKTYIENQLDGNYVDEEADAYRYRSDKETNIGHEDQESTYSKFISIIYRNYIHKMFVYLGILSQYS